MPQAVKKLLVKEMSSKNFTQFHNSNILCLFYISVKPDAPEQLEIIRKDKNAVRLRWKKPTDFGRFECTHFVISKRHSVSEEWQMIAKVPPNELSYWVTDLPYKDVYFSVAAENAAGIGQPAVTEKPETITYPKGRYYREG